MKQTHLCLAHSRSALQRTPGRILTLLLTTGMMALSARADMYQPRATPGGISPQPWITSFVHQGTNTTLNWYGLAGGYDVLMSPTLYPSQWTTVASPLATDYANSLTLPNTTGSQNFFVMSPVNNYVGSGTCNRCHPDTHSTWQNTAHASAYSAIASRPAGTIQQCYVCHTVGNGWPSGFVDATNTPWLENVGCENCHGPGAAHVYGEHELVQPAATVAAEVCGGCHSGARYHTYEEWTNSPHATPVADAVSSFSDTPSGQSRMMSCGPCHSGAVRDAMLNNLELVQEGYLTTSNAITLPASSDAKLYAQTCAVCHDPHQTNGSPAQLRNPLASTNFFSYSTALAAATNQFGELINLNFNNQYRSEHSGLRPVPQPPRRPVDRHLPPATQLASVQHASGRRRSY